MKIITILALFVCSSLHALAQRHAFKQFSDDTNVYSYLGFKGDTIKITTDSLYMMNPRTYKLFNLALLTVKKKQQLDQEISGLYEESLKVAIDRIQKQREEFKELNNLTQALVDSSSSFVSRTDKNLIDITVQLKATSENLSKANENLNVALAEIKAAQKKRWKIFGSGFISGALLSTIFILIAK